MLRTSIFAALTGALGSFGKSVKMSSLREIATPKNSPKVKPKKTEKLDFVSRSRSGMGLFRGRTSGEIFMQPIKVRRPSKHVQALYGMEDNHEWF